MYDEKVMAHFQNPRNVGSIENADGVGEVGNPKCGDVLKITIRVENDRIVDIKFEPFACVAAIATSSLTTEMVKGKTIGEAFKFSEKVMAEGLGDLPPNKLDCSKLAAEGLRKAIEDYCSRRGRTLKSVTED